jgi:hypothetical protein
MVPSGTISAVCGSTRWPRASQTMSQIRDAQIHGLGARPRAGTVVLRHGSRRHAASTSFWIFASIAATGTLKSLPILIVGICPFRAASYAAFLPMP